MTPDYHRPGALDEATALLAAAPRVVLAGGTDLYPATKAQSLGGSVLDLNGIPALKRIDVTDAGWRFGALVTWTDILRADLPPAFDGLKLAAREVGSVQIQNAGTLAGNLCNASPAADGVPPLLTLDAQVEIASAQGIRAIALSAFLLGARKTALAPDEIVSAILIPATAGQGVSDFLKLGARKYLVISIAMVATRLVIDNGCITAAAIAVGSCSATAQRLPGLEAALIGQRPASLAIDAILIAPALNPIDDVRGSAAYRLDAAVELVKRSIERTCA